MSSLKIADIVHYLTARRRVYDDAFAGDVLRMTKLHGDGPVQEAAKAARSAQAEASAETATRRFNPAALPLQQDADSRLGVAANSNHLN